MGLRSFLQSSVRMLKLATKPGRTELWLSVKICFLGTAAVGAIGFLVHLVAVMLGE